MKIKNISFQGIRGVFILLVLFTASAFSKFEISNLDLSSNVKTKKVQTQFKSGVKKVTLGDYVWFDHNQNGVQDRGELGLGDIMVKLYASADCSGSSIQETTTSNIGYYQFTTVASSTQKYCISIEYPPFWTATKSNQCEADLDSNIDESRDGVGFIKNISLEDSKQALDVGIYHEDSNCQVPSLALGTIGVHDYSASWGRKAWLEMKFTNFVAHAYCHEYNNHGPKEGDKYSVHFSDRLGFTKRQREKLSRVFNFSSDPEVLALFAATFDKTESYYWIEMFNNLFVWYVSDWNSSITELNKTIDESKWFSKLTANEKSALKSIAELIVNKIEGSNGATQYAPIKVYYLWNEDSDSRQDAIVPETFLIPNYGECKSDIDPILQVNLGDKVWLDADKNGKQESGELGLKGLKVELYRNDKLLTSTLTNAQGVYSFSNIEAGVYQVKFIKKEGYSFTQKDASGVSSALNSDADVVTGLTDEIILESSNLNIDAGMYVTPKPSISISVETNNGNVSNIIVGDTITWTYVIENTGNEVLTNLEIVDNKVGNITECTGSGSLERLTPSQTISCTKVGVAVLGSYENSATVKAKDARDSIVTDSDSSSYVGKDAPVVLSTVGNYVWLDSNRNGIQDSGELPLGGVTVQLLDETNKVLQSTKTDASGEYWFKDVSAGKYRVKFTVPSAYTVTKQSEGSDRNKDSDSNENGLTALFDVVSGECNSAIDMGLYPTLVNLGDRVWFDSNKNGIQDASEKKGVSGVVVKLYREDKTFIAKTTTTTSGKYLFRNLVPGNYYVIFSIPQTYKVSPKRQGSNESDDSNADTTTGKTDTFTLLAGIDNKSIDMGLYQESTKVGDRVFYDTNKNGIQDSGESGVKDVDVALYRVGENTPVEETKTSATGIYLFDDVAPGEYYIIFTAPAGYTITESGKGTPETDSNADSTGRTGNFILVAGTQNSTIDMGIYQDVVSFGDRVFLDTNHNGLQDIGEQGVRDINVTIFSANSDFKKSMLTDENGNYLFTHLPAGEYSVEFRDIPYGHLITQKDVNNNQNDQNDSDGFIENEKIITEVALLTPGTIDLSWDLGIYKTVCLPGKSVLGNLVWEDFNKNGIQDIGERGVANVVVTLFNNDTDEKVATTKTDENGLYEFTHIDPNFNYYVQFTVPAGYVVSPQDQDDETIDSDVDENGKTDTIVLTADKINSTVDMGIYHTGSTIGDRVWFDELNGVSNGIQDIGEQGAFDVKVTLYGEDGSVVKTTRTNASGEYHFTNVDKGRYTVGFSELPTGYIFVQKAQGSDNEKDSDVNANGKTGIIVVNGTAIISSIDAGLKKVTSGTASNDRKKGITGKNVTLDVLANDVEGSFNFDARTVKITSTPDGATLSADGKTLTVPNEGVWSVDADTGAITFMPEDGFVGDPTPISYSVQDTEGNETGAEVEVDYPPLAKDDNVNGEVGKQIVIFVLENDAATSTPLDKTSIRLIDLNSGDLVETITVVGEGIWSTNVDGSITFTPESGFVNNPTAIDYVVREVGGDVSNRARVTIVYPDAVDDVAIVPAGHTGSTSVNVTENDSSNTVPTTVTIGCTQTGVKKLIVPNEGEWSVIDSGTILFTPVTGFIGDPTDIQYTVGLVDGNRSNCATVDIRHELLVVDDVATLNVGAVSIVNILDNDFGNINAQTVQLIIPNNPVQGTTVSADGRVLTVPGEGVWSVNDEGVVNFTAENGFTSSPTPIKYSVENSDGVRSNLATITLTEGGVSVIANDDVGSANGGAPVVINVLDNDSGDLNRTSVRFIDANGNEVTSLNVSGEGVWTINNGVVTFTGNPGYTGTPTPVRYVVYDNTALLSDTATVSITGVCVCKAYEESIPVMSKLAALLVFILTTVLGGLVLRKEENFS